MTQSYQFHTLAGALHPSGHRTIKVGDKSRSQKVQASKQKPNAPVRLRSESIAISRESVLITNCSQCDGLAVPFLDEERSSCGDRTSAR